MSHGDPSPNLARVRPRWAALSLVLVAGLAGCHKYELAFGPSSGSMHFEGSDPMGTFSGDVSAWDCHARFVDGDTSVSFGGTRRNDVISLLYNGSIHVSVRGGGWTVDRSMCRAFDVRKWFDAEKHLHVVVELADCTSRGGVRVQGSVRSDACYVDRPR
jgi:hypothetical protein